MTFAELEELGVSQDYKEDSMYLFSVDDYKYFLVNQKLCEALMESLPKMETADGKVLTWQNISFFRTLEKSWLGFVGITASQIYRWVSLHKYCGSCGQPLEQSQTERAFICRHCNITEYPKIAPVVIVGVVDEDQLLLTKYANSNYKKYALIAGFGEVGETLEDTVRREVLEEVGLKVTDITYYKSQPWSFSDSLLMGFYAKLDGDNTVSLDDGELAEGKWFPKEALPVNEERIALTAEMIRYFRDGNDVFSKS